MLVATSMSLIRVNRFLFSCPFRSLIQSSVITQARTHASGTGEDAVTGEVDDPEGKSESAEEITFKSTQILEGLGQNIMGSMRRPKKVDRSKEKDRRFPISVAVSIKYMESDAYKQTYRRYLVWQAFRRNFGNQLHRPPFLNRVSCIGDDGFIKYGQPCPICRDEYLVLDYTNVKLISQFISPFTALVYPNRKTHLCQKKHEELLVAIEKAKMYGTMPFQIPFRLYDYGDYYLPEQLVNVRLEQGSDLSEDPVLHKALQEEEWGAHHDYALESFP